jgi:hypothetical protein
MHQYGMAPIKLLRDKKERKSKICYLSSYLSSLKREKNLRG